MTATPETTDSSQNPQPNGQPTDMSAEQIRTNVLRLWDDCDGWIPGSAYRGLARALGVSDERMLECRIARRAKFKEDNE